jgi:hypothetical protein
VIILEENFMDMIERMESLVPEYSYSSVNDMVRTDRDVRLYLVGEIKKVKNMLFHVVQVGYELHRDRLSEAAEGAYDDIDSLLDRVENSKTSKMAGSEKFCEECKKRIEQDMHNLIRSDRQLVVKVMDMKRTVHLLHMALMGEGREGHFIKNLEKIKNYRNEINSLLESREKSIVG